MTCHRGDIWEIASSQSIKTTLCDESLQFSEINAISETKSKYVCLNEYIEPEPYRICNFTMVCKCADTRVLHTCTCCKSKHTLPPSFKSKSLFLKSHLPSRSAWCVLEKSRTSRRGIWKQPSINDFCTDSQHQLSSNSRGDGLWENIDFSPGSDKVVVINYDTSGKWLSGIELTKVLWGAYSCVHTYTWIGLCSVVFHAVCTGEIIISHCLTIPRTICPH